LPPRPRATIPVSGSISLGLEFAALGSEFSFVASSGRLPLRGRALTLSPKLERTSSAKVAWQLGSAVHGTRMYGPSSRSSTIFALTCSCAANAAGQTATIALYPIGPPGAPSDFRRVRPCLSGAVSTTKPTGYSPPDLPPSCACDSVTVTSCCRLLRSITNCGLSKKDACLGQPPALPGLSPFMRHSPVTDVRRIGAGCPLASCSIFSAAAAGRAQNGWRLVVARDFGEEGDRPCVQWIDSPIVHDGPNHTLPATRFLGFNTRSKRSIATPSASGSCCSFNDRVYPLNTGPVTSYRSINTGPSCSCGC
jgi:hypothetical protein